MSLLDNVLSSKAWTTVLIDSGPEKGKDRWYLGYTKPLMLDNFYALDLLSRHPPGSRIYQWNGSRWVEPAALALRR